MITVKESEVIKMRVIETGFQNYPIKIRDAWEGEIFLSEADIPFLIEELKKMLDK